MVRSLLFGVPLVAALSLPLACGHKPAPVAVAVAEAPELEPLADQQAHASTPDGERVLSTLHGFAGGPGEFTEWNVPLEVGRCYSFGYAGDGGVSRFSLYIWDPANHRAETDRNRPRQGVVPYCPTVNGVHRLQGKVTAGAGHFAVVAYAKQVAVVAAPPPPRDLTAIIEDQAASAAPGAARIGEFYSGQTPMTDWVTSLDAGKCYWIIGAGETGKVKRLYLYLWDPHNTRLSQSKTESDTAMVGYCAKESGMYKFQAKVDSGSGMYKVGVYAK